MFELLESRRLLAGNVRASLTKDGLIIRGDDTSNGVEIRRVDNHTVKIQGFTVGGSATSINGRSNGSVTLSTDKDVTCYLHGGADDRLTIQGPAQSQPATFRQRLLVDGGEGRDTIQLKHVSVLGDCRFSLDDGGDHLTLRYLYVGDDLSIHSAESADRNDKSIDIRGNNYVAGDTEISLSNGNDSVQISRFQTDRLEIRLRDGNDLLAVDYVHADGGVFHGGAGGDTLLLGVNDFPTFPQLRGFNSFA